jgi:hypothetical protein
LIWPGYAEAIRLSRTDPRYETMPDSAVIFGEWVLCLAARRIEEAEVDTFGTRCTHREVRPGRSRCRSQGKPISGQYRGSPGLVDSHGSTIK